ncbi:pectinesterase family protein [Streptomyces sp. NBC_01537]|uniref:pectinesterase family protein n=1 Tax=Streptomyces sp. NBC_01537 TaxID=2903896 RepID=UPI003866196B
MTTNTGHPTRTQQHRHRWLRPASGLSAVLALVAGATAGATLGSTGTASAAATITVAADGSGNFTTVQAAVNAVPAGNSSRVIISIAPGTYREKVTVPATKPYVTFQGTGSSRSSTKIVYGVASGSPKGDGTTYGTGGSATVTAYADEFQARNLTIANDFDEAAHDYANEQAVALYTAGDRTVLDSVIFDGNQDTLLLHSRSTSLRARVYVNNAIISGDVDFIFGGATAVINKTAITVKSDRTSYGIVLAPSTPAAYHGFLVINSSITGSGTTAATYLGRPWHAGGDASLDPEAIVRNSSLGAIVRSAPWTDMSGFSWKDDRFAEYANSGAGAGTASSDRPFLTVSQAADYEIADWLDGWTPST